MQVCQSATEKEVYCRILDRDQPADATRLAATIGYPECGAVVTFLGTVRQTENGRPLAALDYEHHETMAACELEKVLREATERFDVRQVACEHSTGRIAVQEASVAVAVGADHRQHAFDACEYIMNRLKEVVPIWKNPIFADETSKHGTTTS